MSCSEKLIKGGTFDGSKFTDGELLNSTITNGEFKGGMEIASSTGAELVDGIKEPLVDVIKEVVETNLLEKLEANEGLFDDLAIKNSIELSLQAKADILEALTDELKEEFADAFAELIKEEQSYHMNGGSITGSTTIYASAANSIFRAITSRLEALIEESLKKAFCDLDALEGATLKDSTLEGCVSLDDKAKKALADALNDAITETIEEVLAGIKEFVGAEIKDGKLTGDVDLDDDAKKSLSEALNNAISDDLHKLLQDNFECWAKDAVWGDVSTVVEDVGFKLNEETGILTIIVKNINVVTGERSEDKIEVPVSSEDPDYKFTDQGVAVDGDKLGKDVEFVDKSALDKYEEDFGKLKKDYEELLAKCEDLDPKIKELLDKLKEVQDGHADIWDFMEYLEECGGCAVNRPTPLVGITHSGERVEYTIPRDAVDGTAIEWQLSDLAEVVDWGGTVTTRDNIWITLPNVKKVPSDGPKWTTNYCGMFANNKGLDTSNMSTWDLVGVKSVQEMFSSAGDFDWGFIEGWNTSSITNMRGTFSHLDNFDPDLGAWDTSSVTTMNSMFAYTRSFSGRGVGMWDTSSVTDMGEMFMAEESADPSADGPKHNEVFNPDLSRWDVQKVTNMQDMFTKCTSFEGRGLEKWETSSLVHMARVANKCYSFKADLSGWDVSKVTSMRFSFTGTKINFSVGTWDVGQVESFRGTFANAGDFGGGGLEGWRPVSAEDMHEMFYGVSGLDVDLSGWKVPLIPSTPSQFTTSPHMTKDKLPQWGG